MKKQFNGELNIHKELMGFQYFPSPPWNVPNGKQQLVFKDLIVSMEFHFWAGFGIWRYYK
jgi:hypothetical protein